MIEARGKRARKVGSAGGKGENFLLAGVASNECSRAWFGTSSIVPSAEARSYYTPDRARGWDADPEDW